MSYSDYANIIAGYNSKASSKREASEGRYANFKSGFRERGLAAMNNFEEQANKSYQKTLADAQTSALKALGVDEEKRAKAEALVGAGVAGGPVVDKLLKATLGKSKTKKGAKGLAEKLKSAKKEGKTNMEKLDTELKVRRRARQLDKEGGLDIKKKEGGLELEDEREEEFEGADDLVGQQRITEEPTPQLSEKARGKQPIRSETRGGDTEMTSIRRKPVRTGEDIERDDFFKDAQERAGLDPKLPTKTTTTEGMEGFLDDAQMQLTAPATNPEYKLSDYYTKTPAAEAPAAEAGGAEALEAGGAKALETGGAKALETLGTDVALDEAAAAPLDVIPGIGELAAAGAAIYGVGQFFGLWGGGSHKKEEPIDVQPHIASTTVQSGVSTGSYRGMNKATAAPTINSGIMR